jgi:hypothetical protein
MIVIIIVVGFAIRQPVKESTTVSTTPTPIPTPTQTVEQNQDNGLVQETNESYTSAEEPTTSSGAMDAIAFIMPMLFVMSIIFYVFKGFGSFGTPAKHEITRQKVRKMIRNSKEFVLRIETSSKKYAKFVQNLDKLFKLTTLEIDKPYQPLELVYNRVEDAQGNFDELKISKEYDWFITDKHPDRYIFKVVGLHKKDEDRNVVYLLGFNEDDKTALVKISGLNMETKVEEIVEHYSEYFSKR